MINSRGNVVKNQFVIHDNGCEMFQSYQSLIAIVDRRTSPIKVTLDEGTWDYSVTTSKYRNQFLGETKKETQAKIDSGEYQLANLN
tara:strand:- start:960 stop:1217 length:258 start_codon:yes stop_codon:yes gene_type:complete